MAKKNKVGQKIEDIQSSDAEGEPDFSDPEDFVDDITDEGKFLNKTPMM